MEKVSFHKGDIVCQKKRFGRQYLRVTNAMGNYCYCRPMGAGNEDKLLLIPKKQLYKYKIGSVTVHKSILKKLVLGETTVVFGPPTPTWKKICVSMIHPVPDVIKINNGWKGYAIFQYVEAARVYIAQEIHVRLEIGQLLEEYDV